MNSNTKKQIHRQRIGHLILTFAAAVLLWIGFGTAPAAAEPDPVFPLGKTPIGTQEAADPTIAREGDWYYVFSTGTGISVRRSKNLIDWEMLPPVFPTPVPAWARAKIPTGPAGEMVWAPDILNFQDKYYLYYCVSTLGSQHSVVGLATATTLDPKNPKAGWHDEGLVLESFPDKDPFNALDPSMCVDEQGNPWLVWGSYWKGIYLQRLNPANGKLLENAQRHHIASRATTATPQAGIEGATITRKNGYYYLFVSHDDFIRYNVKVGRSKSITGPYLDRQGRPLMEGHGTPVLAPYGKYRGTGHNGLLIDDCPWFDVMVHHHLMPESRDLQVRPIFWSQDGWPLVGEPLGPQQTIQGQWFHQVGCREIYRINFAPNGEVTAHNGVKGKWTLKDRNLSLRWPMPDGTEAVDECVLSPDHSTYVGRNAQDTDIRGWRDPAQGGQVTAAASAEAQDPAIESLSQKRWSPERAWQWSTNQPWICGFNYVPANSISYTEMWMDYAFDEKAMDRELALAQDIGFNCLRVVLPYVVWEAEPDAFKQRFEVFLALCAKRGLKVMPCFFDDCVFGPIADPVFGKQPEVVPGWYANGWTPSPGHKLVRDPQARPKLERYVKDVMTAHRDDPRILCWDLYNEPSNGDMGNDSLPLLRDVFRWAREVNPTQPVTSGVWGGSEQVAALQRAASDIITFHYYAPAADLSRLITELKQLGRPLICTEWLNRPNQSIVETCLPVLAGQRVGALHWGLVNGKTQTHLPWGHRPGGAESKVWQHDLYRPDLQPYDAREIELFKNAIKASAAR